MKQLALFSREPWCFPRRGQGKHQDSKENKTHWFPEGPDIKFFVIFLDFHFNSNKRITGANQNSPVGTYNNTNLILKTAEWMIYASVNSSCAGHLPTPLRWIKEWVLVTCGVLWLDLVFSSIFLYFNLRPLCLRPEPLWTLNTPFF